MVSAGIIVDLLFAALKLIPEVRPPSAIAQAILSMELHDVAGFCRNHFKRLVCVDSFEANTGGRK